MTNYFDIVQKIDVVIVVHYEVICLPAPDVRHINISDINPSCEEDAIEYSAGVSLYLPVVVPVGQPPKR